MAPAFAARLGVGYEKRAMGALGRVVHLVAAGHVLARDAVRTALTLREVERARWVEGPGPLVDRMRARGLASAPRTAASRLRLLRLVHHLDRFVAGGPNCYRRTLVRMALDPSSAREPFILGLNPNAAVEPGHAWIDGDRAGPFDVEFRL